MICRGLVVARDLLPPLRDTTALTPCGLKEHPQACKYEQHGIRVRTNKHRVPCGHRQHGIRAGASHVPRGMRLPASAPATLTDSSLATPTLRVLRTRHARYWLWYACAFAFVEPALSFCLQTGLPAGFLWGGQGCAHCGGCGLGGHEPAYVRMMLACLARESPGGSRRLSSSNPRWRPVCGVFCVCCPLRPCLRDPSSRVVDSAQNSPQP